MVKRVKNLMFHTVLQKICFIRNQIDGVKTLILAESQKSSKFFCRKFNAPAETTKHFPAIKYFLENIRGRSRAAATSKMERFVIIVNGFQPLTIITKCSIQNVAAALDPPLNMLRINVTKIKFANLRNFGCISQ